MDCDLLNYFFMDEGLKAIRMKIVIKFDGVDGKLKIQKKKELEHLDRPDERIHILLCKYFKQIFY